MNEAQRLLLLLVFFILGMEKTKISMKSHGDVNSIHFTLYGYAKDSTNKQYLLLICIACVLMSLR